MTKTKAAKPPVLTNPQKKQLRSLGHELAPVVLAGREGLSANLIAATRAAFKTRELIKIKIGQNAPIEREEAAAELARQSGSALVQLVGRVLLLYRPNPELPAEKRIAL